MTREEAIRILYSIDNADEMDEEFAEAYNMAIKALEQEPCDDCISRQAVIDAIEDDNRNGHYSCFATNNDAQCFKDVIRELPSVTPQPCEDCISRQAVFDLPRIKTHNVWGNVIYESVDVENVRQLPSVTPQQKMGRWSHDQFTNQPTCSTCGYKVFGWQTNYCPACGAKMSEIPTWAEGSDKE